VGDERIELAGANEGKEPRESPGRRLDLVDSGSSQEVLLVGAARLRDDSGTHESGELAREDADAISAVAPVTRTRWPSRRLPRSRPYSAVRPATSRAAAAGLAVALEGHAPPIDAAAEDVACDGAFS
jgi:hypothetical protein